MKMGLQEVGRTPALAWSTWNYFAQDINETLILEIADALVSTGMRDAGFRTVNIDAGYMAHERNNVSGKLQVNSERFPRGIRFLSDELHRKQLKIGVYTDLGKGGCGPLPGSFGHYALDAATFANDWQIDYLKVDFCGKMVSRTNPSAQYNAWASLGSALKETGRDVYFSICPHATAPAIGTAAAYAGKSVYSPPPEWTLDQRRTVADSILVEYLNNFDFWYSDTTPAGDGGPIPLPGGIITNLDAMLQMTDLSYSGCGPCTEDGRGHRMAGQQCCSWNDADMLQMCTYGEGATRHFKGRGMALAEYRAHYSVWAILASPLIHSADVRTVAERHPECLRLMLNREIIAVNQDPMGSPPFLIYQHNNATNGTSGGADSAVTITSKVITQQAFGRKLLGSNSSHSLCHQIAVVLLNRDEHAANMSVAWKELGIPANLTMKVRDVIAQHDAGTALGSYSVIVEKHDVAFVILAPLSC